MKWICRIFILTCALTTSQAPFFIQAYLMHLDGHIAENTYYLSLLEENARKSNKHIDEYIEKFVFHEDIDIQREGVSMRTLYQRHQFLIAAKQAISSAHPLARPFISLWHMDTKIAQETFATFTVGITASQDSFLWFCIGAIIGQSTLWIVRRLLRSKQA